MSGAIKIEGAVVGVLGLTSVPQPCQGEHDGPCPLVFTTIVLFPCLLLCEPPVYGAVQCPSCIVMQPVCKQDPTGLAARASRRQMRSSAAVVRSYSRQMAYRTAWRISYMGGSLCSGLWASNLARVNSERKCVCRFVELLCLYWTHVKARVDK